MRWRKLGVVYKPDGSMWWARTHAMVPTPLLVSDGLIRIYLTCQDASGVGRVGFVDLSARDPSRVVNVARTPVLDIGRAGAFDDNGVMATSVLRAPDGKLFLYYVGFELCTRVRYRLLSGLAVSDDGVCFSRVQETPILERSPEELYFRGGPYVCYESGCYCMWYVAGSQWILLGGKQMPVYELRYAESCDGIRWPTRGQVALPITGDDEHGFGRPWILRGDSGWKLLYSVRRRSLGAYRLGFAVSVDRKTWRRHDDEFGLDTSHEGWDSQAVCYGAALVCDGHTWLFYNGNNFGETGFGLAVREE